jgi:hypothetical protein
MALQNNKLHKCHKPHTKLQKKWTTCGPTITIVAVSFSLNIPNTVLRDHHIHQGYLQLKEQCLYSRGISLVV